MEKNNNGAQRFGLRRKSPAELWSNIPAQLIVANFISATQLRVYLVLNTYAHCEIVYPSYQNIADKSCLSRMTVYTSLIELEKIGLLEKVRRYEDSGQKTSNDYELLSIKEWMQMQDDRKTAFENIEILNKLYKLNLESELEQKRNANDFLIIEGGEDRYVHIPQSILFDEELTATELRVFLVLSLYKNLAHVFPNLDTLTKQACVAKQTLVTALKNLDGKKYIEKFVGSNTMNGRLSNNYKILK